MHHDILEHMPAGLLVWRLEDAEDPSSLRLVLANRQADRLSGMSLSEMTGIAYADIPFKLTGADDPTAYAAVVRTGEPLNFGECSTSASTSPARYYQVQAFVLPDRCIGVAFHDITEERELGIQLQHAQRMELIGRLAGGVAHDFNNLLTIIRGFADLLRQRVANDPIAAEDLNEVERACGSAHQLTRQLLAFGRRQVLQPKPMDLHAFVGSTRGMLNRIIGDDVQLHTIGESPVIVSADAGQLEQVLLNLVVNARDAMPAGGKLFVESSLVHIGVDPVVPPGVYGALTVSDTGLGMDAATVARVFEPFFTTKEVGKGTGLGLSTVHGIVKQSGGHITVTSEPGKGTSVTVYLPVSDTPAAEGWITVRDEPTRPLASCTVLLVEDNDSVRHLIRRILSSAGLTVLDAADPEGALSLAGRFTGRIDLLITDVVMPRQSGPELAARLSTTLPGLRIMFISGYLRETTAGYCKLPPHSIVVRKPFAPADLMVAVQRALEGDTSGEPEPHADALM
jgi:signal transduction histidine kinase/CheY-like chemotaxis protein